MMHKKVRAAIVPAAVFLGAQIVYSLMMPVPARSDSGGCPGYQPGDLNRWAEVQGRRLRYRMQDYRSGDVNRWADNAGRQLSARVRSILPLGMSQAAYQRKRLEIQQTEAYSNWGSN